MAKRKSAKRKKHNKKQTVSKEKKVQIKPYQSTQKNVPIEKLVNGCIVDKEGNVSTIIEVVPSPFMLKKTNEQNGIVRNFEQMLKIAPSQFHIKCISTNANLAPQIDSAYKSLEEEESYECRQMCGEYIRHLQYAQDVGTRRRFFISIPYEGNLSPRSEDYLTNSTEQLLKVRSRMESNLRSMGNDIVTTPKGKSINYNNGEIFYTILNRRTSQRQSFDERMGEVFSNYIDNGGNDDTYIPISEFVAPKTLNFLNSKFVECDGVIYTFLYIPSNYFPSTTYPGWLYPFVISQTGIDVDIFFNKQDRQKTIVNLKRNLGHAITDVSDNTNVVTDSYEASRDTFQSTSYLKNGLSAGQDLYEMSVMVTVSGSTVQEVIEKTEELCNYAKQIDMKLETLDYQEEEAFKTVLPTPYLDKVFFNKMHRNCLTEGASSFYPFLASELIHDKGTYIADDMNSGVPVIPDFFDSMYTNPHIFICGKTGAGKTVTIQLMALRYRVKHVPVYIIAPEKEHEFSRICEKIGGQFVSIGNGSTNRLNIFDISVPSRKAREKIAAVDGRDPLSSILLAKKITELLDFFAIYIPNLKEPMFQEMKMELNDALLQTYKEKGITEDNDSLWADEYHRHLKEFPIMSDLVDVLERRHEKTNNEYSASLARMVRGLTRGGGAHFNGHTNVDISNKFFVIGLENNSEEYFGLSIYLAMEFLWTKIKEDRSSSKVLIMDEWWKMAYNPIAAERTMEIARLARAESCSMVIATQQMSDILAVENGKYGNAILNSCSTKIIMGLENKDIQSIREMVELSKEEAQSIKEFDKGEALMLTGENRMRIKFSPSKTEQALTFTDQETINKVAIASKKERQERARQEAIKNAKDISDVFDTFY
jgi:conjugal transfer ATP-binding protein TraC